MWPHCPVIFKIYGQIWEIILDHQLRNKFAFWNLWCWKNWKIDKNEKNILSTIGLNFVAILGTVYNLLLSLVSDAARRTRDAGACPSVPHFYLFIFFHFTTQANACWIGLIRANLGHIGPYRVKPSKRRNSKKKKGAKSSSLSLSVLFSCLYSV